MRVRFGDFVFDSGSRELIQAGQARRLSTKGFVLLETLLSNAPRALKKEELYQQVWGDIFVEEVNLPNLVSEVRSVLGESRKAPRFIKTIHGFGYAFAGELLMETPEKSAVHLGPSRYVLYWRREEFPLKEGETVIGRGGEADITIDSAAISRRHARLLVGAGGVKVEDLGSKNGTFVGDQRISGPTAVEDGDEIRLGKISMSLRASTGAGSTVTEMSRT